MTKEGMVREGKAPAEWFWNNYIYNFTQGITNISKGLDTSCPNPSVPFVFALFCEFVWLA